MAGQIKCIKLGFKMWFSEFLMISKMSQLCLLKKILCLGRMKLQIKNKIKKKEEMTGILIKFSILSTLNLAFVFSKLLLY